MAKLIILCLAIIAACEAGLIHRELVYPNFPHLRTVDHGHGATSYQNVNVQNFGSVPIPKDLQVDDGNEYQHHSQYLHDDLHENHQISSLELQHYDEDDHSDVNQVIVSSEAPYELEEPLEHVELQSQHHYAPNHYEHHDQEGEFEYH